jgi:putative ABC transport system permease protein
MALLETLHVAVDSLRANKTRTALTLLGIIIGVAAVITMIALGRGAERRIQERIGSLGVNVLSVMSGRGFHRGLSSQVEYLTPKDAEAILRSADAVSGVAPTMGGDLQVEYTFSNYTTEVTGTWPTYPTIRDYHISLGRFFDESEEDGRRRVAVLAADVPENLGTTGEKLLGQRIMIRGISFDVIGILEAKGQSGGWRNPDDEIFIPLSTAQFRVFGTDRLRSIEVQVADQRLMGAAEAQIERVLRRQHKLAQGEPDDFRIGNWADLLGTYEESARTFKLLLAGIATVSLLVGGIGIMNIMLVSVTERTREIGVRKALGATSGSILFQFLVESLVVCSAGGVVGIFLGIGAALALARFAGWNTSVGAGSVVLAFAFSAAVGVFFGIYPARRASILDPIVALRYE